jgi:hypothetical protein
MVAEPLADVKPLRPKERAMEIARLITLEEAAQRLGIQPRTLIRYAKEGKIGAKLFLHGDTMLVAMEEKEMNGQKPKREDFAHLEGRGISIYRAVKSYGVPLSTIQSWIRRGLIRVIGHGPRRAKLLDESDVAYCAALWHSVPAKPRGRRVFIEQS